MQSGYPELDVIVDGSTNVPTIKMGGTTITERNGILYMEQVQVNRVTGDGSGLTNLPIQSLPLSIDTVQIVDATWSPIDDTAVDVTNGGYILINGTGLAPGSMVQVVNGVNQTNAIQVSYVSSNQLRVQVPPQPSGTYDITVIRADSATVTKVSALTYSLGVSWTTNTDLGNVSTGIDFSITLQATSDSTVTYANTTTLPPDTVLDSVTGNFQGNIVSVSEETLYSFDVQATDAEFQDAIRTFLVQVLVTYRGGKLLPNDPEAGGNFGFSCAMSEDGTRVVIGAHQDDASGGTNSGAAYIFSFTGVWTQTQKLVPSDGEENAYFGRSCAMSADGTRVVIGADQDDVSGRTNSGAAYVFVYNNTTQQFEQQQKLVPDDSLAYALFGVSCSMSNDGTKIVVSAKEMVINGLTRAGAAYIFIDSGSGLNPWVQEQQLLPETSSSRAFFGWSCTMSGDGVRVIVGASVETVDGQSGAGAAYIFVYNGTAWIEEQRIVANTPSRNDYFGDSCAMSDDGVYLVVGSTYDDVGSGDPPSDNTGAVYVFTRNGSVWTQEQKIDGLIAEGNFGFSCAMSADGQRIVVGTQDATLSGYVGTAHGETYIFSRNAANPPESRWTLEQTLNTNPSADARFGCSSAMSSDGERVIVGAFGEKSGTDSGSGAAYAIVRSPAGVWE